MKRSELPLLTLRAMVRRKWVNIPIAAAIAICAAAAIILCRAITRQEKAQQRMVDETEIRCVLTDLQGRNSDHLNILSGTVEQLMGVGRGEGNPLADVVDRVRASAVIPLTEPEPYTMQRILDFASTEDLSPLSSAVITMRDGWTEDVFQTNQTVCLVPEELVTDETETLTVQEQGFEPRDLTIVGTVRNLKEKAIYCPFLMSWPEHIDRVFTTDSCSFAVRDNNRLEETRQVLYETFAKPSLALPERDKRCGVLIQDETYLKTLTQLDGNLTTLRLLANVLLVLCCCMGILTSWLSTKGRIREFGVMRCLGLSTGRICGLVLMEIVCLTAAGGALGIAGAALIELTLPTAALRQVGWVLLAYLAGAVVSVLRICRINTMKLMKVEE